MADSALGQASDKTMDICHGVPRLLQWLNWYPASDPPSMKNNHTSFLSSDPPGLAFQFVLWQTGWVLTISFLFFFPGHQRCVPSRPVFSPLLSGSVAANHRRRTPPACGCHGQIESPEINPYTYGQLIYDK